MDGSVGLGETVDWPALLLDLRRHGYGVVRVAEALNLPRQTVQSWQGEGAEPRYTNGMMLIRLYLAVVDARVPPTRFAVPLSISR